MEREKGEHTLGLDIWSSILSENTSEFMSWECGVWLEGWRWLGRWIGYDRYEAHNYDTLKKSIFAQYPGAKEGVKYTWQDLELIVASLSNNDISMETELLQYYHKFRPVTVWLVTNKKISDHERNRYFWQGLPMVVYCAVDQQLELKNANYSYNKLMDYEVLKASWFILSDNAFDTDLNDLIAAWLQTLQEGQTGLDKCTRAAQQPTAQLDSNNEDKEKDHKKDVPWDVHTKRVSFDQQALAKSQYDEVKELVCKMHSLDIVDISYDTLYTQLICLASAAMQACPTPMTCQPGAWSTLSQFLSQSYLSNVAALPLLCMQWSAFQVGLCMCWGSDLSRMNCLHQWISEFLWWLLHLQAPDYWKSQRNYQQALPAPANHH